MTLTPPGYRQIVAEKCDHTHWSGMVTVRGCGAWRGRDRRTETESQLLRRAQGEGRFYENREMKDPRKGRDGQERERN